MREEVLANVARQLYELRDYLTAFHSNLIYRCSQKTYDQRGVFSAQRYSRLFSPVFALLLDCDDGQPVSLPGSAVGPGGGGGDGARLPQPVNPGAKRSLAKSSPFGDGISATPSSSQQAQAGVQSWPAAGGWPDLLRPAGRRRNSQGSSRTSWLRTLWPIRQCLPAERGAATRAQSRTRTARRHLRQRSRPDPPPSSASPAAAAVKVELAPKELFSCQPQHVYVTSDHYNSIPANEVRKPACGCGRRFGSGYRPGLHAPWDCPLRYWQM